MKRITRQLALAAALIFSAVALHAQCVSSAIQASQPSVFPNRAVSFVAWTGTQFGVVKTDAQTGSIYVAAYDSELNQLSPDRKVVDTPLGQPVAFNWNGSEFALFYQTPSLQLVFQLISPSGDPLGAPVPVAPAHTNWQNQEYDVAWDATRNAYVVVHTIPTGMETGLWLSIVSRTGQVLYDGQMTYYIAPLSQPRVSVTPTGEIGFLWVRRDSALEALYFGVVDKNNQLTGFTDVSVNGRNAVIANNGKVFLVITGAPTSGGASSELRSAQIDFKANVVAPDATFLPARGVDISPRSLVWNPTLGEWALVYSESIAGFNVFPGETRLRRFGPGIRTSDTLFSPEPTKNIYAANYPVLWNGRSYVATIARAVSRAEGSDTLLVRHCPLVGSPAASQAYFAQYAFAQFRATVSGGTPDYRYSWDFGDRTTGEGPAPKHQYIHTGTYTVTLTVTDTGGGVHVSTTSVNVVVPRGRVARH